MANPTAAPLGPPRHLAHVRTALIIAVATGATVLAALGYVVSFEAISSFVVRIGALPTGLRWCGPLLVDTFITIATLFLVWLATSGVRLRGCPDAWYAWTLIAVATIASAYLNAAHVQPPQPTAVAGQVATVAGQMATVRWDARVTAGAVPFAVLASVHLLVLLLLRLLATGTASDDAPPAEPAPQTTVTRRATSATTGGSATAPQRAIAPLRTRRATDQTRHIYERLAADGQPVTWRQFAEAFDPPMPRRTAQRHLAAHQTASANGHPGRLDLDEVTP